MSATAPSAAETTSRRPPTFVMAAVTGIAAACIYYNQPLIGLMAVEFPGEAIGLVPMASLLGYALGLLLLVPLGDIVERRRSVTVLFVALAVALALVAIAPGAWFLLAASLLVGIFASVAQQVLPLAAHLASPERRGAAVGAVMAGLLGGIFVSRALAGTVAGAFGWRAMFWLGVPLALGAALAMALRLPRIPPQARMGYGTLLKSLAAQWRDLPALRHAAVTQAMLFGAYSVLWTVLALHLFEPPYRLGADATGLFGLLGITGVIAAPLVGRIADRHGPRRLIVVGTAASLASWAVLAGWPALSGLILGVALLDGGVQVAVVSHQHIVFSLRPEARNRINTVFMVTMFLGGSAGSALATLAWAQGGWITACALGAAMATVAAILQLPTLLPEKA